MNNYKYLEVKCPLCQSDSPGQVLYEQNFTSEELNTKTFSPKEIRKNYHYRMLKCTNCGMTYASPILDNETISNLYLGSNFSYSDEEENLVKTYFQYYDQIKGMLKNRERAMEIGCGSGFFLNNVLKNEFKEVYGVEPCTKAVDSSPIKDRIRNELFDSNNYERDSFDLICFFQVLDHASNPNDFLQGILRCLKPEGLALCVTHNIDALSSKILGEKCPIVDVNHVVLFNKKTLRKIFVKNDFQILKVFDLQNIYSLGYWLMMLNLPRPIMSPLQSMLSAFRLRNRMLKLKAGNIGIIAKKIA